MLIRRLNDVVRTVLGAAVLCSAMHGCAVGPDYEPPAIELPKGYEEAEALTSGGPSDARWWASFEDPLLDELIAGVVAENTDVKQALSRVNQARALRRIARAELLPGLEVRGGYEKGQDSGARFPGGSDFGDGDDGGDGDGDEERGFSRSFEYELYSAGIDALWELDIFGRLRRNLEASNAEIEASIAALDDAVRIIVAETALTYFELRGAQIQLAIAAKNLELQQESLRVAQAKFDLGQTSELDTVRAKAQLEETKASVSPLVTMVKTNIHRLSVLSAKQPGALAEKLEPTGDIPSYHGPLKLDDPGELLRRRPDIRRAERQLAAETARIGVAVGELYPKVELVGSLGVEAAVFSDLTKGAGTYRLAPGIRWTPFDTGRLRAEVSRQNERAAEALSVFEETVLLALEDVENALARYVSETQRKIHLQAAVEASKRAYEVASAQYREGLTDFLSVLDAQRRVLENESSFVESEKNVVTALVGIYKAFGGGWEAWDLAARED